MQLEMRLVGSLYSERSRLQVLSALLLLSIISILAMLLVLPALPDSTWRVLAHGRGDPEVQGQMDNTSYHAVPVPESLSGRDQDSGGANDLS